MKNLFRALGALCLVLAVIFFLYGSMKTASGAEQGKNETVLEDGIILVEKNDEQRLASYGFNTAAILGIGGLLLLFLARVTQKR